MKLYFQKQAKLSDFDFAPSPFKVGIHGIKGAFTDEAWHIFSNEAGLTKNQYLTLELVHSEKVLSSVATGKADVGIFAFSNSGSGGYLASIEAMGRYNYLLIALFTMPINMCLLAHKDVNSIEDIKEFYGHPVAVSQCRKTLQEKWPDIPIKLATDKLDTALSAKLLASGEISKEKAIFASSRAAEIYGLKILKEGVHHDLNNATSFAVITKE